MEPKGSLLLPPPQTIPMFISAIFSSDANITFEVNQTAFTLSFPYI